MSEDAGRVGQGAAPATVSILKRVRQSQIEAQNRIAKLFERRPKTRPSAPLTGDITEGGSGSEDKKAAAVVTGTQAPKGDGAPKPSRQELTDRLTVVNREIRILEKEQLLKSPKDPKRGSAGESRRKTGNQSLAPETKHALSRSQGESVTVDLTPEKQAAELLNKLVSTEQDDPFSGEMPVLENKDVFSESGADGKGELLFGGMERLNPTGDRLNSATEAEVEEIIYQLEDLSNRVNEVEKKRSKPLSENPVYRSADESRRKTGRPEPKHPLSHAQEESAKVDLPRQEEDAQSSAVISDSKAKGLASNKTGQPNDTTVNSVSSEPDPLPGSKSNHDLFSVGEPDDKGLYSTRKPKEEVGQVKEASGSKGAIGHSSSSSSSALPSATETEDSKKTEDVKSSLSARNKLFIALGSIAALLLVSGAGVFGLSQLKAVTDRLPFLRKLSIR